MHAARSHPPASFDPRRLRRLVALIGLLAVLAVLLVMLTGLASSDPERAPLPYAATGQHGAPTRVAPPVLVGETWAADESARGTSSERAH